MMVTCKKCGAEFATGSEVGSHARDKHSNPAKQGDEFIPYRCYQCPGLFHSTQEAAAHRFEHEHPDEGFWDFYHRKYDGAPSRLDAFKKAAYYRNVEGLILMGFVPKVDGNLPCSSSSTRRSRRCRRGITGYHLP